MEQVPIEKSGRPGGVFGIPAAALAALPACPACYPAYAGVLSALGLGSVMEMSLRAQASLTVVFLAATLLSLGFRARSRRGYGPLALGAVASLGVLVGKFFLLLDPVIYGAVGLLLAACVWNVWPVRAAEACDACAPTDGLPAAGGVV